ncbi:MAG: hypothetical protein EBV68_11835, partial [Betaproteobacteria bacterium]|nr:hypothetical protein [Betaproteobacteria bacterium]
EKTEALFSLCETYRCEAFKKGAVNLVKDVGNGIGRVVKDIGSSNIGKAILPTTEKEAQCRQWLRPSLPFFGSWVAAGSLRIYSGRHDQGLKVRLQ